MLATFWIYIRNTQDISTWPNLFPVDFRYDKVPAIEPF